MMGRTKPKDEPVNIVRSTSQDEMLTIAQDGGDSVLCIVVTEQAGKQTILLHFHNSSLMMSSGGVFRPTTEEARAIRDFLIEMLPQ